MQNYLTSLKTYESLARELFTKKAPVCAAGLNDSGRVMLSSALCRALPAEDTGTGRENNGWLLYLCADEREIPGLITDFGTFYPEVTVYPAKDLLFSSSDIHGNHLRNQRAEARKRLVEESSGVLITTIDALMDKIPSREQLSAEKLTLKEGMVIPEKTLGTLLEGMGYERTAETEVMGQYAIRGGIVDIFPISADMPVRIEFFDDEIDTVRSFDAESHRSVERIPETVIYPVSEAKQADSSILRYFPEDAVIAAENPDRLLEKAKLTETEFTEAVARRLEKHLEAEEEAEVCDIFPASVIFEELSVRPVVYFTDFDEIPAGFGAKKAFDFHTATVGSYKNSMELLISELRQYEEKQFRITVMSPSRTRTSRLAENLREMGIRAFCPDESSGELMPGTAEVVYGTLRSGFSCPEEKYVLFTENDMFGKSVQTRRKKKKSFLKGEKLSSLEELSVGDYVVHESHGIGIYQGISRIEREDTAKDYIHIVYADGGSLFLPATRLDLVQKYTGAEGRKPKLNRLNGTEWQKTKTRVLKAVDDLAKELVEIYAKRSVIPGHKYSQDTVWQREFEELFPYEETEDQLSAIEAVKQDMESGKIMDRLICGDVGYGKTEIALRAAFKAVQDGKQVAYLVPTTILARQHYTTFCERLKGFPVNVEMMSRFQTNEENKKTAQKLGSGLVDIVIGTHRILSKDVQFKDLGLLIIDEEQRFGVAHKEKIKKMKTDVDVLVLTATPIPRTLHMSLSGIRDLSVLEEPPFDRIPIQTYVMEYNDEMVREAVHRETQRGGQVFYVYNRVKGIEEKTAKLQNLLPDLRIEYAHGQMPERELENIMMEFVAGEIDVLVSTTIIETGLDIPNANTLIVDGAERLGLSQLYQIRGRVGRSSRTSYAFLMYRKDRILSEEAEKRLKAIREFTEFGSGIKIAMRDLEIRGAGNVLGAEQSGQMEAVGYELYCKMLKQAVGLLSGTVEKKPELDPQIECEIDAFLPETYITSEYDKLDLYQRIAAITDRESYYDIVDELTDRFGDIPREVMNLLEIARIKYLCRKASVTELTIRRDGFTMLFRPNADICVEAIPGLIAEERGKLRLQRGSAPRFLYKDEKSVHVDALYMAEKAESLLQALIPGNSEKNSQKNRVK